MRAKKEWRFLRSDRSRRYSFRLELIWLDFIWFYSTILNKIFSSKKLKYDVMANTCRSNWLQYVAFIGIDMKRSNEIRFHRCSRLRMRGWVTCSYRTIHVGISKHRISLSEHRYRVSIQSPLPHASLPAIRALVSGSVMPRRDGRRIRPQRSRMIDAERRSSFIIHVAQCHCMGRYHLSYN